MRILTRDSVIFVLPDYGDEGNTLRIDRVSGAMERTKEFVDPMSCSMQYSYALVGMISLLRGSYLVTVSEASTVGFIQGKEILTAEEIRLIPISPRTLEEDLKTPTTRQTEAKFLVLVNDLFKRYKFYFSYSWDLTNTFQRQIDKMKSGTFLTPIWKRVDKRFVWNFNLCEQFLSQDLSEWIFPMVCGLVEIQKLCIQDQAFDFILISRRSWKHAGTRYTTRGLNQDGDAANFVETEQSVLKYVPDTNETVNQSNSRKKYFVASFVLTRGSIPLIWRQRVNLKYSPAIEITDEDKSVDLFIKHFEEQTKIYGDQVIINLINQKGREGKLEKLFRNLVSMPSSVENNLIYEAFDFHHECKKSWKNLSKLLSRIEPNLDEMGYLLAEYRVGSSSVEVSIAKRQKSVFRVNCMDNLDRTNVVQSMLAQRILDSQLKDLRILEADSSFFTIDSLESKFKNIWADNADVLSMHYAGTGALKTDFTRSGRRTFAGKLRDFQNSVQRYYLNNFVDGERQDAIDLIIGNYVPTSSTQLERKSRFSILLLFRTVLLIVFISLSVLSMTSFAYPLMDTFSEITFYSIISAFFLTHSVALLNGRSYVNRPALFNPLKDV